MRIGRIAAANPVVPILLCLGALTVIAGRAAADVFPGADETTPARAQYFSWINNTNEGATEAQTLVNLDFFEWLRTEYGMQLDIYAFDAGAIDGKRCYGSTASARFREQFPNHFDAVHARAGRMDIRLGIWGGPDGFGETPGEARTPVPMASKRLVLTRGSAR